MTLCCYVKNTAWEGFGCYVNKLKWWVFYGVGYLWLYLNEFELQNSNTLSPKSLQDILINLVSQSYFAIFLCPFILICPCAKIVELLHSRSLRKIKQSCEQRCDTTKIFYLSFYLPFIIYLSNNEVYSLAKTCNVSSSARETPRITSIMIYVTE